MSDLGIELEMLESKRPSIVHIQHWQEFLYDLQVKHLKLPSGSDEYSTTVGMSGNWITAELLMRLREDRLDSHGNPYVICTDEQSDEDLVYESNQKDIYAAFDRSVEQVISRIAHQFKPNDPHAQVYMDRERGLLAVAQSLAQSVYRLNYHEGTVYIKKIINESSIKDEALKSNLIDNLLHIPESDINEIIDFIGFSQTQPLKAESRVIMGLPPEAEIGSEPLEIGDSTFNFTHGEAPQVEGYTVDDTDHLSPVDAQFLIPLSAAIKRSRKDMIEQAKLLAIEEYGRESSDVEGKLPPEWWVKRTDMESLRSDEVLIFIPQNGIPLTVSPGMKKLVEYIKIHQTRPVTYGWYLMRIEKQSEAGDIKLSKVGHLHN